MPGVKQVFDAPTKWQAGRRIGIDVDNNGIRLWRPDMYGAFDDDLALVGKDGSSVAPLTGHVATLRPGEGRFGGAVAVEEGTTNLIANPSFENNLTSWGNWGSPSVREVITSDAYHGSRALRIVTTGNNQGVEQVVSLTDGATYTLSCYVKVLSGRAVLMTRAGDIYLETETPPEWTGDGKWHRFSLTFTANNTSYIWIGKSSSGAVGEYLFDAVQLEAKPFATSFVDGTRAAGKLQYDGGLVNPDSFTIAAWVLADWTKVNEYGRVWELRSPSSNDRLEFVRAQMDEGFRLYFHLDGTAQFGINKTGFPSGWYHTVVTFDGNQYQLYVNGESIINVAHTEKVGADWRLNVGCVPDAASPRFWNSLIDELLILPYAASDEEIRSWYEQDAPLKQAAQGVIELPPLDLSPVTEAAGSTVSWNALEPPATSAEVEIRLSTDGGQTWIDWQSVTNGGAIPGITSGANLANVMLQARVTLESTDADVTPTMDHLALRVPMAGHLSAPTRYAFGVRRAFAAPTRYEVGVVRSVNLPVRYEVGTKRSIEIPLEAKMVGISPRFAARRMIAAQLFLSRPDGQTWEDVTEALSYVSWNLGDVSSLGTGNEGVDQRVRTANFRLHQHRIPGGPNLSPLDRESPWNRFNGDYDPLVWPLKMVVYRVSIGDPRNDMPHRHLTVRWAERIGTGDGVNRTFYLHPAPITVNTERIYVNGELMERTVDYTVDYDTGEVTFAKAPAAGLPITADYSYWRTAFVGYVDDWKADGSTVELICRDKASWLQDTYIEVTRAYGSAEGTPLEQVIQKILDDNMGFGEIPLYVQRPTGFLVTPYLVEYQSVWDAIQTAVVKTIGWYLGYRYDEKTNDFHLMLLEPPRNKGPEDADWAFDWRDDIYVNEVGGSIADVRNVCRVTFRNTATGLRETVTYQDDESIRKYRRRAMQIEEADASMIDTPEEAMRLAKAAVDDLKDQHATVRMEIPFSPFVEVMDGILITDERISSTQHFFAVESVEHVMDFDAARFRTSIVASGRVAGAHGLWLEMETRPGAQQPTKMIAADRVEVTQSRPPKPEGVRAFGIPMGIVVTVPEPGYVMKNWKFTRVRVYNASGDLVAQYEARSSRFEFSGLAIGGTYTAEAQYEDTEGATGEWSDRVSAVASGDVAFLSMSVSENLTVGGTANVSGTVTGQVVRATQYIQLPVLSADPSNPPNGAMWMRS